MSSLIVKGWRYYDQEETKAYREGYQHDETFIRVSKNNRSSASSNNASSNSNTGDMMTQYEDRVIKRAKEIAAEEWAKGVEHIHSHRLNSMWYEPEPHKVKHKNVLDITYNDGRIERDGVEILPSQVKGKALLDRWEQFNTL